MTSAFKIEIVCNDAGLVRLAPDWWALWSRSSATPFQSPAWLIAWWRAFRPGDLCTIAVWLGHKLVGLAPFYIEQGVRRRLLPLGISISDYLDVLTDPVMKEPVLSAMAKQISALPSWDEWELAELRPGAAGLDMPCPIGCSTQEYASAACPTLHLRPSSGSGGFCTLPKTKQRKLRMAMHRLTRHEAFAIIATPERQAAWWQRELWRLHSARWLTRGQTGVLTDGRSAAFHAEALPLLIDRGIARLYALRIGEEVAGIYYGFSHHTHAYAYLGGFDPAFAYYSPGTVLIGHAIAEAAAEGAHTFHFLRGGEAYKYAWGAEDQFNLGRVTSRCAS